MNKSITDKRNITDLLILIMGAAYLLFLIWAILYKCGTPFLGDGTQRIINLLPFNSNTTWELQFNIAVFIPYGFYLSAVGRKMGTVKQIAVVAATSFSFELVQFILAVGRSDITDLLMNTLGGIIGITVFYLMIKLFGKHERKASFIICVLMTLLMVYMTVSFVFFGVLNIGFMKIRL